MIKIKIKKHVENMMWECVKINEIVCDGLLNGDVQLHHCVISLSVDQKKYSLYV